MNASQAPSKRLFWRSPAALLAACGVAALLFATTKGACTAMHFVERKAQQKRLFKYMIVGIQAYDDTHDCLPASITRNKAGKACCSWRLALTVFLGGIKTPHEIDQPWDSPLNAQMAAQRLIFFGFTRADSEQGTFESHVAVVMGPGTPIQDGRSMKLEDVPGDTILIVEAPHASSHWMKPGDLTLDQIDETFLLGCDGRGVMVGFVDGEVMFLKPHTPLADLKLFFVAQPERPRDREKMLRPYAQ